MRLQYVNFHSILISTNQLVICAFLIASTHQQRPSSPTPGPAPKKVSSNNDRYLLLHRLFLRAHRAALRSFFPELQSSHTTNLGDNQTRCEASRPLPRRSRPPRIPWRLRALAAHSTLPSGRLRESGPFLPTFLTRMPSLFSSNRFRR